MADPNDLQQRLQPESKLIPGPIRRQQLGLHDTVKLFIAVLEENHKILDAPSEDFNKVTPFTFGDRKEDFQNRVCHMAEIIVLSVQLIFKFSMTIPGFDLLCKEDQATLLKAHSSEVMMLRAAEKYDETTDSIVLDKNLSLKRQNFNLVNEEKFGDALFQFCLTMHSMKIDKACYALLTTIVIFSESTLLREPRKVEEIQDFCIQALKSYVTTIQPKHKSYFSRLLSMLVEIRTLADMNSKQILVFENHKRVSPLLQDFSSIISQHHIQTSCRNDKKQSRVPILYDITQLA